MRSIQIGKDAHGHGVNIDIDPILRGRLLIQGGSGSGKSYLARLMAERLFGKLPVIIIDVEGEFASLREKFGYVLVGPGGETPADVRSAALLARRLLELNASAVCDLYEMQPAARHQWVKLFLESLLNAPKNLWQEAVIIVDEAHKFCPEKGAGESIASEAMVSLATLGRKRGYGVVFATQRLGKLRKDAAAELQNVLIGRTFIDIDRDRVMDTLGVSKKGKDGEAFGHELKALGEGQFWAFGPALTLERTLVNVGQVSTSHPKIGQSKRSRTPPPAPERVRALLPKLADLPREADEKQATEAELRRQVRDLEGQVRAAKSAGPKPAAAAPARDVKVLTAEDRRVLERLATVLEQNTLAMMVAANGAELELRKSVERYLTDTKALIDHTASLAGKMADAKGVRAALAKVEDVRASQVRGVAIASPALRPAAEPAAAGVRVAYAETADPGLGRGGLYRMLVVLAQHPKGLTLSQLGVRSKVARSGGSWSTYLSKGKVNGWIGGDSHVRITEAGLVALGPFESLPEGQELARHYLAQLGQGGAGRMLKVLIEAYPNALTLDELSEQSNIDRNGGSWSTYLSKLRTLELVEGKSEIKASADLF